jgi:hypothetical protein
VRERGTITRVCDEFAVKPEPEPAPPAPLSASKQPVIAAPRGEPWESEGLGAGAFKQGNRYLRDGEVHVHPQHGVGVRMCGDTPWLKGEGRGRQQTMIGPPGGYSQRFGQPHWRQRMIEEDRAYQRSKQPWPY